MEIFSWDEMEAKTLLKEIAINKKNNRPIKNAIINHADRFLRSADSVKKFYYKLKTTEFFKDYTQDALKEELRINSFNLRPSQRIEEYSKKNLDNLLHRVYDLKIKEEKKGEQVSMFKNREIKLPTSKKTIVNKKIENSNVQTLKLLQMPTRNNILSQNDLNSLFLGLVSLLKKNIESGFKSEIECLKSDVKAKNQKVIGLLNINVALKKQLNAEKIMQDVAKAKSIKKNDEVIKNQMPFRPASVIRESENFKKLKSKFGINKAHINELKVKLDAYKINTIKSKKVGE